MVGFERFVVSSRIGGKQREDGKRVLRAACESALRERVARACCESVLLSPMSQRSLSSTLALAFASITSLGLRRGGERDGTVKSRTQMLRAANCARYEHAFNAKNRAL